MKFILYFSIYKVSMVVKVMCAHQGAVYRCDSNLNSQASFVIYILITNFCAMIIIYS